MRSEPALAPGAQPLGYRAAPMLDVSVIVPTRNAEAWIEECLDSIVRSGPREIIMMDGDSTDRTLEIAGRYEDVTILSDRGTGVAGARRIGAETATSDVVALIDSDVILPDGALAELLDEFRNGGYTGLQAGLDSISGPGYWGRALAQHHHWGLSKNWFGVMATLLDRAALLEHGFDERFVSGEDIDLRFRLERAGAKIGVSRSTTVKHRFGDTFEFARDQWSQDGKGLARMVRIHGVRALWAAMLPFAAAVRGVLLSGIRLQPQWIPYYLAFLVGNYVAMARALARPQTR
jgi:glycosyltransferase involved in cell wall biosynthesis